MAQHIARKRFGQNFLRDPNLARVAIDRAQLRPDDAPDKGIHPSELTTENDR